VGIRADDDEIPFDEKMREYSEKISDLLSKEEELNKNNKEVFKTLEYKV
jgi:hypothetical protein